MLRAALILLISTAPALAFPAQGSLADHQRAAKLRDRFSRIPIGETFRGSWLDGHRLWRLTGPAADRRVEVIDPEAAGGGQRSSLPVRDLPGGAAPLRAAGLDGADVLLLCADGRIIRWAPGAGSVRGVEPGAPEAEPFRGEVRTGRAPQRSRGRGAETRLLIVNETQETLGVEWVTTDGGRRSYGSLAPGASMNQHTFDGHVFALVGADGEDRAWVRGSAEPTVARVGRDSRPRRREGRRRDGPRREASASPWKVRFPGGGLTILDSRDGGEYPLASADEAGGVRFEGPARWSPDARSVIVWRATGPEAHPVHIVESSPADQVQPRLLTFDYLKPGDRIRQRWPVLVRLDGDEPRLVDTGLEALMPNPWSVSREAWSHDGARFDCVYNERGHRVVRVVSIDVASGEARSIVEEAPDTFVDYAGKLFLHRFPPGADGSEDLLWMSERSGWNHLLLIDARTGEVRREVTSGPWVVRAVDHVDDESRRARIRVMGVNEGEDPYHVHFAEVDVDTGELTMLTEGDGTHRIEMSPDGRWLIDRWSRVDLPEQVALRPARGGGSLPLASASSQALEDAGWRAPERFVAKGRDGETDIWGIVVRPTNHDPGVKYPVVEQIYAGPHGAHVPKDFRRLRYVQELAELGFIVVQIDGMGTNWRSKAFHDVAWKNLGDAGFPDRRAWLAALAEADPSVDLTRVGIYGGSAGGQNAMRALIDHSDVYDVAVADCGCHDNRMDKIWWNELWMSWPVGPHYAESSNVEQAHRTEGELLLIVGELDRNVDPASTMQVVDALVRADKDFDLLVIPGAGHGAAESAYGRRRRSDFLVRHLMGVEPRWE
ncbi:MAG: prolyl oligopeptidase family serine peptidase [Planctomycetota bacterium]|nr:prolyl oligopeptidase family serine peptidase [Planctomycetota bacterium]